MENDTFIEELQTALAERHEIDWAQHNFDAIEQYFLKLSGLLANVEKTHADLAPIKAEIESSRLTLHSFEEAVDRFQDINEDLEAGESDEDDFLTELNSLEEDCEEYLSTLQDNLVTAEEHLQEYLQGQQHVEKSERLI